MNGKQHCIFGASTALALNLGLGNEPLMVATSVTLATIGCLLPDLDTKTSTLGRKLPFISNALNFIFDLFDDRDNRIILNSRNKKQESDTNVYANHRRYFHDPVFWGILAYFGLTNVPFLFYLFFGIAGHLLLDAFTSAGIPFFYLFRRKSVIYLTPYKHRFRSNSDTAAILTIFLSIVSICIIKAIFVII